MGLRIVIAPNEDGLGSSAWAVRLAKSLCEQARDRVSAVLVLVSSERLARFHSRTYGPAPVQVVRLASVQHPFRLVKAAGGVDVEATARQYVLSYPRYRRSYVAAVSACRALNNADLIIDLGVPPLLRAASATGLPCLSLSDHAWSLTLRQMLLHEALLDGAMERALQEISSDERLAGRAIAFPAPLTPPEYETYWRGELGLPFYRLPGVLGGPLWSQRWAGPPAREAVRRLLGIEDDLPVLHVTGGGTPVWEGILSELVKEYLRVPPAYHVVFYAPAVARQLGVTMTEKKSPLGAVELGRRREWPRLAFIGTTTGETHHVLFAGFDMVLTRAGGGTVNDAIAFRVPLLLVEEKNHWQVERIRQECCRMGLARAVTLEEFRRQGRALVETASGELAVCAGAATAMARIPNHAERWLVEYLLELGEMGS